MTGTGLSTMAVRMAGMRLGAAAPRSDRSAPEQNTVPAPVSTTARTSASLVASRNASSNCANKRAERALRLAGESSVRVRTPSRCCTPTNTSVTVAQCRGAFDARVKKGRWYRAPVIESDEHQLFRKTLRDLFEREIEPHVDEWEAARIFPAHELFPKLAAVGLFGLEYDEADGGMGADHTYSLIAGEEMGRISCGGVPMAMAVQMSMATPALARYGSPS